MEVDSDGNGSSGAALAKQIGSVEAQVGHVNSIRRVTLATAAPERLPVRLASAVHQPSPAGRYPTEGTLCATAHE